MAWKKINWQNLLFFKGVKTDFSTMMNVSDLAIIMYLCMDYSRKGSIAMHMHSAFLIGK